MTHKYALESIRHQSIASDHYRLVPVSDIQEHDLPKKRNSIDILSFQKMS